MPHPTFIAEPIDHPRGWRVRTAEGGTILFTDEHEVKAFAARRTAVTWTRSTPATHTLCDDVARSAATDLLRFAQRANLFPDRNGNCSWRGTLPRTLVVTPRQVEKALCLPEHLIIAEHHPEERRLVYAGTRKPSIDASVQATLYERLPKIDGLLHVHAEAGLFLADATTTFPFPCGTQEEAEMVVDTIIAQARIGFTPFIVELIHHGYLIALYHEHLAQLDHEWDAAIIAYTDHLAEIGHADTVTRLTLQPIIGQGHIVGVIATDRTERWSSVFLQPAYRSNGLGRRILPLLARRGVPIRAHALCAVTDFYCSHGWHIISRDEHTVLLTPE